MPNNWNCLCTVLWNMCIRKYFKTFYGHRKIGGSKSVDMTSSAFRTACPRHSTAIGFISWYKNHTLLMPIQVRTNLTRINGQQMAKGTNYWHGWLMDAGMKTCWHVEILRNLKEQSMKVTMDFTITLLGLTWVLWVCKANATATHHYHHNRHFILLLPCEAQSYKYLYIFKIAWQRSHFLQVGQVWQILNKTKMEWRKVSWTIASHAHQNDCTWQDMLLPKYDNSWSYLQRNHHCHHCHPPPPPPPHHHHHHL